MIDKQKILQYLDNIQHQLEDPEKMPVPNAEFLFRNHFERTKAIKYSLLVAIEDIIHISAQIVAALGLGKPKDASGAVLLLGNANLLPFPFARQIVGMVIPETSLFTNISPASLKQNGSSRIYASG